MLRSNQSRSRALRRVLSWSIAATLAVPLATLSGDVSAAASCGTPTFGPATAVTASAGMIAVADFDVDGVPDVIAGDQLRYGDGAGGFVAAQTVPNVRAVAAVDLGGVTPPIGIKNEAPELLAESASTPGRAVVGLGSGGRGSPFGGLAGFPVFGGAVLAGAAADLTGDGISDLVYSHGGPTQKAYIWKGATMSPNWQPEVAPIELGIADANAMVVGDFDDDGIAELVIASTSGNALLYLNYRAGAWLQKSVTVAGGPQGLAVADLNGDGYLDLVATTTSGNLVTLLGTGQELRTNPGGSTLIGDPFSAPTSVAVGGDLRAVALGDVTGDQRFDGVVVDRGGQRVVVLPGNGSGGFSSPTAFPTGSAAPTSVALADIDRDGALDLISGDATDATFVTRRNSCAQTPVDLAVTGVEVTQGIQDLANSVPLIADRRTFVRVYVAAGSPVDGVTARLARTDGAGTSIERPLWPGNPGGRITVKTSPDRKRLADALLFEIPPAWTAAGPLRLKVDVNPDRLPAESTYTNNTMTTTVTFQPTNPIKIELVKVKFFTEASTTGDTGCDRYKEPTDAALDEAESALRRELPAAKFVFSRSAWDSGLSFPCTVNIFPGVESHVFMTAFVDHYAGAPRDRIRLGIYERDPGGGEADAIPGWFAVSNTTSTNTYVHEIGHLLGQFHKASPRTPPCSADVSPSGTAPYPYPDARIGGPAGTETFVGFDPGDATVGAWPQPRRVVGPDASDLMSYCRDPKWPSDVTWVGMRAGIQAKFSPTDPIGDFLTVRASYDNASATVSGLMGTRRAQLGALDTPAPGPLHLRQLGTGGTVLDDRAFAATPGTEGDTARIDVTVDFAAGTREVAITDAGGSVLASIPVSPNVPVVSSVAVSTGAALPSSGPVTISWTSVDLDGGALTADVLWSNDGGVTFAPLAGNITGSSYTLDASRFSGTSGSTTGVVRVLVRDPVNTGTEDLVGLTAVGSAPRVRIAAPFANESFTRGQTVPLQAYAGDPEDGSLDGAVEWTSSLDGAVGTGGSRTALLSAGTHVLTARVTDVDGNTTTATATVNVFSLLPPGSFSANNVSGYAEANGAKLTLTGDWTVETWFKDETPGGYQHGWTKLLGKVDPNVSGEGDYSISVGFGLLRVSTRRNWQWHSVDYNLIAGGVSAGTWHHVAATLRASTRTLTIYLDGGQVAQGRVALSRGNAVPLSIGRFGDTGGHWNGKIDDLRIWNVVRSAAQIATGFRAELDTPPAGLVANWKFNEASGTNAADSSGSPADATLNSGASFSLDVHP